MKRQGAPASSPASSEQATGTSAFPRFVPKLRFAEFRDDWHRRRLEEVAPLQRGYDLTSSEIKEGIIPVVYSNGVQNFHVVGMATAPGLVTGRSGTIGKLHFIEVGAYWPHNTALWVTSFKENWPKFVYYLFASIGIERFASGSGVPTLNRNDVHDFLTGVPASCAEQQKIAECLSTLDELIGAESQKLDALKAHKKGLMQQLFPREGETLPRLRFPEFQDAPEWIRRPLGEVVELQSGFAFSSSYFGSEGVKLVTPKNFTLFGFGRFDSSNTKFSTETAASKYLCRPGDLLLLLTDLTPTCELLGKPLELSVSDGEVLLNQRIVRVEPISTEVSRAFLKQFFLTEYYSSIIRKTASGTTVRHSSNKILESLGLLFPADTDEQHRIASCLSSLDDLIAAQSTRIDALKTHKQGLMQQLFPSPLNAGP